MPLYEYKCQSCGDVFEIIQKFVDEPLTVHEKCGGKVERLLSAPALQFKGTGWYVTDYGKGNSKEPKKSDSSKSDSSNGSGKSEKSNGTSSGESSGKSETSTKSDASSTTSTSTSTKSDSK